MRILFVIDSLGQGGAERSSVLTAQHFKKAGWQVDFAIFNPENQVCREGLDASGIPVHVLGWGRPFADALKLRTVCERIDPDVVMFCLYRTALRVRLLRLLRPETRIIESLVGFAHSGRLEQKGYWRFFKQAVRKQIDRVSARVAGQHYHAVSKAVSDYYENEFGLRRESIHVVHRGREMPVLLDASERIRIRCEVFNVRPDDILIVTVGRQELPKNHLALVDCAALLQKNHASVPVVFAFVGRDGASTKSINRAIRTGGTDGYFRQVGFRQDVVSVIQAADAFVLPSFHEGLPGAVIEAMSVGLPILASDIPAAREVSADSPGFWFFSPHRPDELTDIVMKFVQNRPKALQLAKSNMEIFRQKFQAEAVMHSMQGMVEMIVRNSGSVPERSHR